MDQLQETNKSSEIDSKPDLCFKMEGGEILGHVINSRIT